jgi:hypothetical protein
MPLLLFLLLLFLVFLLLVLRLLLFLLLLLRPRLLFPLRAARGSGIAKRPRPPVGPLWSRCFGQEMCLAGASF